MYAPSVVHRRHISHLAQLRTLVSRYEKSHTNSIRLSEPRREAPLTDTERKELADLAQRDPSLAAFIIPGPNDPVVKYNTAWSYNVVYHSAEARAVVRDCHVGADCRLGRRMTRLYGKILFFLLLPVKDAPLLTVSVAYVDWFVQQEGDFYNVSRTHASALRVVGRAIPISEIVCKVALVPVSAKGQKCTVVELV